MSGDILCGHSWEEEYGPGKPLKSCSAQGGSLANFPLPNAHGAKVEKSYPRATELRAGPS